MNLNTKHLKDKSVGFATGNNVDQTKHNDIRCPVCLSEWNLADVTAQGHKNCPQCHTPIMPMKISEDGYVKLNWQDVRVLAQYARRWTVFFDRKNKSDVDAIIALNHIVAKLQMCMPKDALPLFPQHEVIEIKQGRPPDMLDETKPIELTPDATGNIPSPFIRKI